MYGVLGSKSSRGTCAHSKLPLPGDVLRQCDAACVSSSEFRWLSDNFILRRGLSAKFESCASSYDSTGDAAKIQ